MAISVLVVEDDRNIAELLQMYLEKEGYAVTIAADGGQRFQDLCGGSAGITDTRTDGAIKRRMRHGFIAAEDQFVF